MDFTAPLRSDLYLLSLFYLAVDHEEEGEDFDIFWDKMEQQNLTVEEDIFSLLGYEEPLCYALEPPADSDPSDL